MAEDAGYANKSVQEILNKTLDRSVDPYVVQIGTAGKDSGGTWRAQLVSADGSPIHISKQSDASSHRTSAIQGDAASLRISAIQSDGSNLRVSAIVDNGSVSAKSSDAATFRISAINSISALSPDAALFRVSGILDSGSVSAKSSDAGTFLISAKQGDGALLRTSALVYDAEYGAGPNVVVSARGTTVASAMKGIVTATVIADAAFGRVSAIGTVTVSSHEVKQSDAASILVSAKSGDGSQLRVSAIQDSGANLNVSAKSDSANLFRVSAILDTGSVSAKSSDAGALLISAKQGDAGLLRVSSMGGDAGNDRTSALQADAGLLLISAKSSTATNLPVSSTQADAGLLRTSAIIFGNTTGGLTIARSLNVSTSFTVKGSGGTIYGWNAWNSDTKPNYIKFTNTSGAINVGTDTPLMTLYLKASGNVDFQTPIGIKGFTAGIGCYSVSAEVDNATTGGTASAVGIDVYYV